MPGTTTSQSLLASLPSFMSVFGDDTSRKIERKVNTPALQGPSANITASNDPLRHGKPFPAVVFRRTSSSTFVSESTESSPTTTISTVDSSITEPSPSSSPESPTSQLPVYSSKHSQTSSPSWTSEMEQDRGPPSPVSSIPGFDRAESPHKKMRNTKNLSLNTFASHRHAATLPRFSNPPALNSSNQGPTHAFSAPPTPSFIVPPKNPMRKPSKLGLSIATPDTGVSNQFGSGLPSMVPQTPAEPHSNFDAPSLFSPTGAPEGGMRLPPFGTSSTTGQFAKARPPLSLSQPSSYDSTRSSPIRVQTLDHVPEEDYELPLSREAKSPAYPQGPVCIYDPLVYLYLEPDDKEALEFDVILNVAREVRNPFVIAAEKAQGLKTKNPITQSDMLSEDFPERRSVSEPQSAVSEKSFSSALESLPNNIEEPSAETPKALRAAPEYIHIPWDHGSNVVDDMLRLCELVDDRVQQGKRVLIHCQCGVSRSASLIVAYGLYKNRELSVQAAYDAVKQRSRWIGPNMHLIYQLSEFRGKLTERIPPAGNGSLRTRRNMGPVRFNTDSLLSTPSSASSSSIMNTECHPSTAPLRSEHENDSQRSDSSTPPVVAQIATVLADDISPGPSTAPPKFDFSSTETRVEATTSQTPALSAMGIRDSPPRILDLSSDVPASSQPISEASSIRASSALPHKSTRPLQSLPGGFSSISTTQSRQGTPQLGLRRRAPSSLNIAARQISSVDVAMPDAMPETPSILSPRAVEFTASPFHRTVAGDLAGSSFFEQQNGPMSPRIQDPRSPPTRGEAPITRSIFDVVEL
ncbi:hypothetical protein MMC09_001859 [Bachmanniomyces sp. S44760]|nr:hypothetical protein [Bachmanniomyces sp. S44760]